MSGWLHLVVSALLLAASAGQQRGASVPSESSPQASGYVYAVSYVEAAASAAPKAVALLTQYRTTSTKQDGFLAVDVFEQIGRPGHFALFEVWRDQATFDAHIASLQKSLLNDLEPIRISGYDQRPYKAVSVADGGGPQPRSARAQAAEVVVVTHVDVAPNPQVAVMLTDLATASRKEPGNIRFDVVQHTMRANHFTVLEVWRDQKALDAHSASPHTKHYRDTLQPMTGSPLDERVYKAVTSG